MEEEAAALVAEINREAEAEKERILCEAREKARRILADADAGVAQATEEASRHAEKQARVDEDRLFGLVRLEAQAARLRGLRRAYERAFEVARERIDALVRSPRYPDALGALVREALERAPQAARVTVAVQDVSVCRDALRGLSAVEVVGASVPPGSVVVSSADGKVKVDNGFAARLAAAYGTMETRITRCLNG